MRLHKKKLQTPDSPKFSSRAERLSKDELHEGIEQCVSNLNKYWPEFLRTRDPAFLYETRLTAEALYIFADFLYDRKEAIDERAPKAARQVKGRF
jgi:hypothetical protein